MPGPHKTNPCVTCGKPCRGDKCKGCHALNWKERFKPCEVCGKLCGGRFCQKCWRSRPNDYAAGPCEVCRVDLATHARCRSCDILAGPGHYVQALTAAVQAVSSGPRSNGDGPREKATEAPAAM